MKTRWMFPIALAGAAIIFAADQPKREPDAAAQVEIAQLQSRVTQLESRLAALEARLPDKPQMQLVLQPRAPLATYDPIAPPHTGEREVNGLKVYTVPLGR